MLAPASLVLVTMLLSAPPAHAGHWAFSVTGTFTPTVTGNASPTLPTWSAPTAATTNSLSLTFPSVIAKDSQGTSNPKCTCSATAPLTITATWTHDTGQTDANDPVPPKVWIVENSSAVWGGSINVTGPVGPPGDDGAQDGAQGVDGTFQPAASPTPVCTCTGYVAQDGLGDTEIDLPAGAPVSGSSKTPQPGTTLPAPGWSSPTVSGKTFTLTRPLKATVTAAGNVPCTATATCSLGSYSVSIQPQPYNMHETSVQDAGSGNLVFGYSWLSTNGNINNLDGNKCFVYEYVSFKGNAQGGPGTDPNTGKPTYVLPHPPVNPFSDGTPYFYEDPTYLQVASNVGGLTDTFRPPSTGFSQPLQAAHWVGTQDYYFQDQATNEYAVHLLGSFTIVRDVHTIANGSYEYSVTTRDGIAKMPLP